MDIKHNHWSYKKRTTSLIVEISTSLLMEELLCEKVDKQNIEQKQHGKQCIQTPS